MLRCNWRCLVLCSLAILIAMHLNSARIVLWLSRNDNFFRTDLQAEPGETLAMPATVTVSSRKPISIAETETVQTFAGAFDKLFKRREPTSSSILDMVFASTEHRRVGAHDPVALATVAAEHALRIYLWKLEAQWGSPPRRDWQLLQDSWRGIMKGLETNVDGLLIPAETSDQSCTLLLSLGALGGLIHNNSAMIEFGTFMGYSTRCMAAGSAVAAIAGHKLPFFAFDVFTYIPKHKATWKQSGFAGKESRLKDPMVYKQQVQQNVKPFEVTLIPGKVQQITPANWGHMPISSFAMDAGKSLDFFTDAMSKISSSLLPGSYVILGDSMVSNVVCTQIGVMLGTVGRSGEAKLIHVATSSSHSIWVMSGAVDPRTFREFRYSQVPATEWDELWEGFTKAVERMYRGTFGAEEIGQDQWFRSFSAKVAAARKCTLHKSR